MQPHSNGSPHTKGSEETGAPMILRKKQGATGNLSNSPPIWQDYWYHIQFSSVNTKQKKQTGDLEYKGNYNKKTIKSNLNKCFGHTFLLVYPKILAFFVFDLLSFHHISVDFHSCRGRALYKIMFSHIPWAGSFSIEALAQ